MIILFGALMLIIEIVLENLLGNLHQLLDDIQDLAWPVWFGRTRGKAAKFFTRFFMSLWTVALFGAVLVFLPAWLSEPEVRAVIRMIGLGCLAVFLAGGVYYLAAYGAAKRERR